MSEALAKRGPAEMVPAFLLDDADTLKEVGSLNFGGDDFVLPRLSICQDLTPHRKRQIMEAQVAALQAEISAEEEELQTLKDKSKLQQKIAGEERERLALARKADSPEFKEGE